MRFLYTDRAVSVILILMFAVVIAGGFYRGGREARAQSKITYRVIGAAKDSTMEKELNEAARQGCEPIIGIGASEYAEGMLVLRCP